MESQQKVFKDVWAKNVTEIMNDSGALGEEVEIFMYVCENNAEQIEKKMLYSSRDVEKNLWQDIKAGRKIYYVQSTVLHIAKERLGYRDDLLLKEQLRLEQTYNKYHESMKDKKLKRAITQLFDKNVIEKLDTELKKNMMFLCTWLWLERMDNLIDLRQHALLMEQYASESMDMRTGIRKNCYGFFYLDGIWKPIYNGNLYTILINWLQYRENGFVVTPIYQKSYQIEQIYKALALFQTELKHVFTKQVLDLFIS